ncbi:NlpC/P60 family protein [Celeribacter baekdonensis]|uniref:NlpC/P60 family protein n=1 Tax=Celeribacter baekdonensis TaxID=875171 RepID=UPI0030D71126|tara:strand:- start:5595 stop:6062 length:468 start_codon:yes stop_codon:yes gene_type:complete
MTWSDRFVGLPQSDLGRDRSGVDCWGLAYVIYQEELSISLPDYLSYVSPDERGEIAAIIEGEKSSPLWLPVEGPAMAFDIALFSVGRYQSHIGIVVRHGLMIHVEGTDQSKLERYDQGRWANRLEGHWRHRDMVANHPVKTPVERPVQMISKAAR